MACSNSYPHLCSNIWILIAICSSFLPLTSCEVGNNDESLRLTILHTNDIQSHFAEFNSNWETCSAESALEGACYGGWARLDTKINEIRDEIREEGGNVLLMDAGNQFGETLWYTVYKDEATSYFMNRTQYDAMAIGKNEFNNGPAGLAEFLKDAYFPVLSCNIDDSGEPAIQDLFTKSHVFTFGGEQVAVVGYTYWNTGEIANVGELSFKQEEESMRKEIHRLKSQGINKIIALGNSDIHVDERIAKTVEDIDLLVGGDARHFFYTGKQPSDDVPEFDYPFLVTPSYDRKATVPIVHAYKYGKYLGRIDVTFDKKGKLTQWSGNPILLDNTIEHDRDTLHEIYQWAEAVDKYTVDYVGTTNVMLDGHEDSCRRNECNLGNLVTDAMVHQHLKTPTSDHWTDVSIAIVNAGGIRTSVKPGRIMASHIHELFPYGSTIDTLDLKGKHLVMALEKSVSEYGTILLHGRFLHFSGLQVNYDLTKPVGNRVVSVDVLCNDCSIPEYQPLDPLKWYKILTNSFIANGGDGYDMIEKFKRNHETGPLDVTVLTAYMIQFSPLHPALEGRISIIGDGSDASTLVSTPHITMIMALACFYIW